MELHVRFVALPLRTPPLATITAAVRSCTSLRHASISHAGLAMLSSIIGKRLSTFLCDRLGRALEDTLAGRFEDGEVTEGDVFASIYGELLGPLFTCLERDGDFTTIRLVSPTGGRSTRADLLLVDESSGLVMLRECNGYCCDDDVVAADPGSLDVRRRIRDQRNEGRRSQLVWPAAAQISSRRVGISASSPRTSLPVAHADG